MDPKEDIELTATELETKIISQIEYYFGDLNLLRDKFLKGLIAQNDGWVPIETLLTFKRLKSLSEDKAIIINALKKSKSGLLEIDDNEEKIRRGEDKPLPEQTEEYMKLLNERTVHVKNFPLDIQLDDLMTFFKEFGSVQSIEMRRNVKTKAFKGCVFVLFSTKEEADSVINKEDLKYNDIVLLKENKINYFLRKKKFSESRKSKNRKTSNSNTNKDNNDVKEEIDGEDVKPSNGDEKHNPVKLEGAVIKLTQMDKNTKFGSIKDIFAKHGRVAYVESVNDKLESFIRFAEANAAKSALEKAKIVTSDDSEVIKVEIDGKDVIAEVLTGDEELEYWVNYDKNRSLSINRKNSKKFKGNQGRGKKGKNMWQKNRKRPYKGSNDSEAQTPKQVKTE